MPVKPVTQSKARRVRQTAAERRALILAAASRRFAEHGFEATTVRQLAEDVKILSGSLYHHFATKEDMLDAIVRAPALAQKDLAVRAAELPLAPEARLVTLLKADLFAQAENQEAFAIIFAERKFFRRSEAFFYVTQARKETFEAWRRILSDGAEVGQFRPDLDIHLTISTIMRMLTMGADWYRNEDGSPQDSWADYTLDELCAFYTGFVLRSIRAPGRGREPIPAPQST